MRRPLPALAALVLPLALAACGGGGTYDSVEALADEMSANGIDCDVEESVETFTEVEPTDTGECSAIDDTLSLQTFAEDDMEQVRADVESAAEDPDNAFVVGENWVVLGDPPGLEQVSDAVGGEYIE